MSRFAIKVPIICGYCGNEMVVFFTSLHSRDNIPGLTPAFCSEKCANSFLLSEDLKQCILALPLP